MLNIVPQRKGPATVITLSLILILNLKTKWEVLALGLVSPPFVQTLNQRRAHDRVHIGGSHFIPLEQTGGGGGLYKWIC